MYYLTRRYAGSVTVLQMPVDDKAEMAKYPFIWLLNFEQIHIF